MRQRVPSNRCHHGRRASASSAVSRSSGRLKRGGLGRRARRPRSPQGRQDHRQRRHPAFGRGPGQPHSRPKPRLRAARCWLVEPRRSLTSGQDPMPGSGNVTTSRWHKDRRPRVTGGERPVSPTTIRPILEQEVARWRRLAPTACPDLDFKLGLQQRFPSGDALDGAGAGSRGCLAPCLAVGPSAIAAFVVVASGAIDGCVRRSARGAESACGAG